MSKLDRDSSESHRGPIPGRRTPTPDTPGIPARGTPAAVAKWRAADGGSFVAFPAAEPSTVATVKKPAATDLSDGNKAEPVSDATGAAPGASDSHGSGDSPGSGGDAGESGSAQ